jgi:hypothetical protein
MPDENVGSADSDSKKVPLKEGYQPQKKGYQPGTSNLNPAKPPQGGSGVPPKESSEKGGDEKK